jgi:GNAT superfamily N-acetyltransferase
MEFQAAIRVFVEGFAFTRSYTHPFLYDALGPSAYRMQDAPRKRKSDVSRSGELVVADLLPSEVDALSRTEMTGRHKICYLLRAGQPDTELRAEFKAMGYRLQTTEGFFCHDLENVTPAPEPIPIVRVTTPDQAERLANAALRRQILREHLTLDPPPIRQYMAFEDGEYPVGWVGSIITSEGAWCASMYVMEAYRRRGIARALMTRMLTDDKQAGAAANVLLASHTGALLYEALRYTRLGTLYLFNPPKSKTSSD